MASANSAEQNNEDNTSRVTDGDNDKVDAETTTAATTTAEDAAAAVVAENDKTETVTPPSKQSTPTHKCPVCGKPAPKRCSRCQKLWYCSGDCQKRHWKAGHKKVCDSLFQSNQYELHKKAFDAISKKYKLNDDSRASEIAELLTNGVDTITAPDFAEKFGMEVPEAVTFLEWIKIGINFKEQSIDTARKAGLSPEHIQTFKVAAKNMGTTNSGGNKRGRR
jgi:ribosomal protein L37AE/L43A